MNNMKRLSLALVALGLSGPAFANSTVLVPSQHGGFKVGIDALYLRPTSSDLHYATSISPLPGSSSGELERKAIVDPSYDWGFYAQVGYLFPCTGNDVTLSYTYLRSEDTGAIIASTPGVIAIFPLSAIFEESFHSATGKSRFDLNAVDLEGGQRFTTGAYDMRMFAGLRYANIDHHLQSFGFPLLAIGVTAGQEFQTQFRGVGPRIGVDSRYCFGSGFGFDANLSTALLVGEVDGRYSANSRSGGTAPSTTTFFQSRNGSEQRLVPVLEAKLGLDYTYIMDCRCKSALTFEVGYQVTNYFNAIDNARVGIPGGVAFSQRNTTTDVAFDGIYFGVKYYA